MNRQAQSRLAAAVLILLSAALILAAARGDLWLDEIWSLGIAQAAQSPADIFLTLHHDNNHPLNTLFLYFLGQQDSLYPYRLLAVLSGIGSLLLLGAIARKEWGTLEALCVLVLAGASYPLLLYFSEARGYAPAIFFGLASYAVLRHDPGSWHWGKVVLFYSTSVLGILSHASFAILTAAFVLQSMAQEVRAGAPPARAAARIVAQHAPPILFFGGWYVFFLRDMVIGGGPVYGTWTVIGQASALLLGLPDQPVQRALATGLVFLLLVLGTVSLRRRGDAQWAFFPAVLVVAPAALLLFARPVYLYFRYFLISFPFFLLLLSYLTCEAYRRLPRPWRWLPAAWVAVLVLGQAPRDYLLLTLQRGSYSAALEYIAKTSPEETVLLGSDDDFGNLMVFHFYAPRIDGGGRLLYVQRPDWLKASPHWILTYSQELSFEPPVKMVMRGGKEGRFIGDYRLVREYRYSGISGWSWFLYRRKDAKAPDVGDG